ncbi:MAG: UDP-N-acetylmuramate--L-alanine ligase [Chloroflexi bacterium]|nr:UDP-N-acetylmuramate--L-alanine ligase [Chloroflexota bacterium]
MKHIHFIGIGGAGLSAIALILLEQGFTVSGSDRERTALFETITAAGAQTFLGHVPQHIEGADLVIRSSAIPDDNPEVVAAQAGGIPVIKRQAFLGELTAGKHTLAVAGTHGKTTTTAMLAWILYQMELDPSYISGGIVSQLGGNAHAGTGSYFVIEADEYDHMFLGLAPKMAIITNIEHEHADFFPTAAEYHEAFKAFTRCIQPDGKLLLCLDDPGIRSLLSELPSLREKSLTYGTGANVQYSAEEITTVEGYPQFELIFHNPIRKKVNLGTINLHVPGHHNVLNATGALAVVHQLGLSLDAARQAIQAFTGADRRFEVVGQVDGVTIINDYGHHPSEIAATLEAAHSRYPEHRVWAVWQPHTFSRTQALADRFIDALALADKVMILKIFAAREVDPGQSAEQFVQAFPVKKAVYASTFDFAAESLIKNLLPGDVVIVFSAGDAIKLSQMLLQRLQRRETDRQEVNP